jgi:exodeoxyribonuclease V
VCKIKLFFKSSLLQKLFKSIMLISHIQNHLEQHLRHTPTPSQSLLIKQLASFLVNYQQNQIFILNGYAGTGKTTMIRALIETLRLFKLNTVLVAPTGRAAKVITHYTGQSAYTIHKKIYRQKSAKDGFGSFELNKNLHANTLFIVDEASMIANYSADGSNFGSGKLLDDLVEYVFNNKHCRLMLIGDEAQLPPVGLELSPALNNKQMDVYGLDISNGSLTDVVRQAEDSGILHNATTLREQIESGIFDIPYFETEGFSDIIRLPGEELIESINDSYDSVGIEQTMIVCRSNKRANLYNNGIRNQILWREEELSAGDILMVVKNNYFWLEENDNENVNFIANGDTIEVLKVRKYEERYGFRFADLVVRMIDYEDIELDLKIVMDTLSTEAASLSADQNKQLFYSVLEDYQEISGKSKQFKKVKEDPFFNALQVKFGYAVTCHKAQGGQWDHVYLDQGYLPDDQLSREYLRWLYTGFTRATKKLYLVNFKQNFFE